jgi:hypothetical protein
MRQVKFKSSLAFNSSQSYSTEQPGNVFGREKVFNVLAHEFVGAPADHVLEHPIRVDDARTLVANDDALIQRLQNTLDLCEPLRLQFAQ